MGICTRDNLRISDGKLRNFLTDWIGDIDREERTLDFFCELLSSMDIALPVTLNNFKKSKNSFDCVTADGKTLSMKLHYANMDDFSKIFVTDGELQTTYAYNDYRGYFCLESEYSMITRNGKELKNRYLSWECYSNLTLPSGHYVTIHIIESSFIDKHSIRNEKSQKKVEDYLITLEYPCTAKSIFENVMVLYGFTSETISSIPFVEVSVEEILSRNKQGVITNKNTLSSINLKNDIALYNFINKKQ